MALTPEQREARKRYLGASEVPAILGLDPYRSAADVFLVKTGQAEEFEGNDATERGNLLEPAILAFAHQELGIFNHSRMIVHKDGLLSANFDGINLNVTDPFVVEAKSSRVSGDFGEPGTDEVPDRVIAQTHAQMLVAGPTCKVAYVPIISFGLEFKMYIVKRDDDLISKILASGTEFMEKFVRPRVRPTDWKPSLEVLKRVRRQPNKITDISGAVIDDWLAARKSLAAAKTRDILATAALIDAMCVTEGGMDESGRCVTYFQQTRPAHAVKESTFRVLRLRNNVRELPAPKRAMEIEQ